MNQDESILAFPAAAAAGEVLQHKVLHGTAAPVIDLQAHRRAKADDVGACVTQEQDDQLSSGDVWDAIRGGRLVVHYQPQYEMHRGKTIAAEALVRLIDANGQLVYPDRFIDTAEQRDLIIPLGRVVIERVCIDLAACRAHGLPIQRIAINLSAHQLNADPGLLTYIDQMVASHGLQYSDLELELTERHGLQPQCEGRRVLNALALRGARIVIDDFGVGYSSVAYLAELPVSAFKLDRSLVARAPEDSRATTLIDSLLVLAKTMGLDVVAEGVESRLQSDYLVTAGCPLAQGYGYARPMPIDALKELIANEDDSIEYASARGMESTSR